MNKTDKRHSQELYFKSKEDNTRPFLSSPYKQMYVLVMFHSLDFHWAILSAIHLLSFNVSNWTLQIPAFNKQERSSDDIYDVDIEHDRKVWLETLSLRFWSSRLGKSWWYSRDAQVRTVMINERVQVISPWSYMSFSCYFFGLASILQLLAVYKRQVWCVLTIAWSWCWYCKLQLTAS